MPQWSTVLDCTGICTVLCTVLLGSTLKCSKLHTLSASHSQWLQMCQWYWDSNQRSAHFDVWDSTHLWLPSAKPLRPIGWERRAESTVSRLSNMEPSPHCSLPEVGDVPSTVVTVRDWQIDLDELTYTYICMYILYVARLINETTDCRTFRPCRPSSTACKTASLPYKTASLPSSSQLYVRRKLIFIRYMTAVLQPGPSACVTTLSTTRFTFSNV